MAIRPGVCQSPVMVTRSMVDDLQANIFADYDRLEKLNKVMPYSFEIELTSKCAGSCSYCYSSSTSAVDIHLSTEKVKELLDLGQKWGVKSICWIGGDPLCHPDWLDILKYAADRGMDGIIVSSGLISKKQARQIAELGPAVKAVNVHIDSINQEVYNKVHTEPKTLQMKIQGYKNLIEAGFPAESISALLTYTTPIVDTIEETIDWYVDEMGCKAVGFVQFKPEGFGDKFKAWEPSLTDARKAFEYRAKKLGPQWLKVGAMDTAMFYCRTNVVINYEGNVIPCDLIRDHVLGNIYEESLEDIFKKHRDVMLFNRPIKGYCGEECPNRDLCFGCRSSAYHYLGDMFASDPKCFMNPDAKETYFR